MRIELDGHDEVRVGTGADAVVDALADPEEVLELLDGMVRPSSTPERWAMAQFRAGPVRVTPAVDVTVRRDGPHRVRIVGRPVEGHTPAELDLTLDVHDHGQDIAAVASAWTVAVEVPGPQALARTIRPLMVASSRSVTRQLADRLRRRFSPPPTPKGR